MGNTQNPALQNIVTAVGTGAGNTSTVNSGFIYHTFTSTGTLSVGSTVSVTALVIAGGGGGGPSPSPYIGGGGGGAGGIVYSTQITLTPQIYTIVVGAGGTTLSGVNELSGYDSYIMDQTGNIIIRALGGGRGGAVDQTETVGGSGGGAYVNTGIAQSGIQTSYSQPVNAGIVTSYGNPGGGKFLGNGVPGGIGAGGGGAGSAGVNNRSAPVPYAIYWSWPGQPGGNGRSGFTPSISEFAGPVIGVPALAPFNGTYGGGGGSGITAHPNRGFPGPSPGGPGGGGNGGGAVQTGSFSIGPIAATSGFRNTGSGGGGGSVSANGASGGSGMVVIRYRIIP